MTFTVWLDGQFRASFATRDAALGYIIAQPGNGVDYEITDETDAL